MGTGTLCGGVKWLGMKLTIYFHLVLRLRMSGDMLALPLYAFVASYNIFKQLYS